MTVSFGFSETSKALLSLAQFYSTLMYEFMYAVAKNIKTRISVQVVTIGSGIKVAFHACEGDIKEENPW